MSPGTLANMDPTKPVNAFQIKRAAHAVSRRDASLPSDNWNPFRHVWTHQRRNTWDAENQTGTRPDDDVDEAGTSPIEHIQTAPARSYREAPEDENGRTSKDADIHGLGRTETGGETFVPSQGTADSTGVDAGGARYRKSDKDLSIPEASKDEEEKPKKEHRLFKRVEPKEPFTFANQIQRTFLNSWINILLILAPVGIVLGVIPNMNEYAIFVVNFVAIIPLAAMLSFATEEIALRTGETLGGLLNATFG